MMYKKKLINFHVVKNVLDKSIKELFCIKNIQPLLFMK